MYVCTCSNTPNVVRLMDGCAVQSRPVLLLSTSRILIFKYESTSVILQSMHFRSLKLQDLRHPPQARPRSQLLIKKTPAGLATSSTMSFCVSCCDGVEARSTSGRRHAVAETEMTGETGGILDELTQWEGVGCIY